MTGSFWDLCEEWQRSDSGSRPWVAWLSSCSRAGCSSLPCRVRDAADASQSRDSRDADEDYSDWPPKDGAAPLPPPQGWQLRPRLGTSDSPADTSDSLLVEDSGGSTRPSSSCEVLELASADVGKKPKSRPARQDSAQQAAPGPGAQTPRKKRPPRGGPMALSPVQEGPDDCRTGSRGRSRGDSEASRRPPSRDNSSIGGLIVEGHAPIVASTILSQARVSAAIVDIRALAAGGAGASPQTYLGRAAKSAESLSEGSEPPRHSPRSDAGSESPWPAQEEEPAWGSGEGTAAEQLAKEKAELRKLQEERESLVEIEAELQRLREDFDGGGPAGAESRTKCCPLRDLGRGWRSTRV